MADTTTPGAAATTPVDSRWLACRDAKPDASADLYCFAHAGGSAGEFVRWSDQLPGIRVRGVKLPGRAPRQDEPPITRMTELVRTLVAEIEFGPGRFAFFGHSLGGLVAHEVARTLRDTGRRMPEQIFVSSVQAPPVQVARPVHGLPPGELLVEIERRWGALPPLVHEDEDLRDLVLGYFRADMEIAETYDFAPGPPLDLPLTVFVGEEEAGDLQGWAVHTSGSFHHHTVPGGHFHFRVPGPRQELLRIVHRAMTTAR
ncbi:thioesterase II family protein [Streptomyces sp. NPDC001922]|uniref:thioesterase II family protein n=1 Tax=Streptomyces sp. NPDC001922 TaxID=3364624 RepID=UPI00368A3A6A